MGNKYSPLIFFFIRCEHKIQVDEEEPVVQNKANDVQRQSQIIKEDVKEEGSNIERVEIDLEEGAVENNYILDIAKDKNLEKNDLKK